MEHILSHEDWLRGISLSSFFAVRPGLAGYTSRYLQKTFFILLFLFCLSQIVILNLFPLFSSYPICVWGMSVRKEGRRNVTVIWSSV